MNCIHFASIVIKDSKGLSKGIVSFNFLSDDPFSDFYGVFSCL